MTTTSTATAPTSPPHDEAELAELNAELVRRIAVSGEGMLSSTRLEGRYAIRLCIVGHATGPADVRRVLRFVEREQVTEGDGAAEVEAHGLPASRADDVPRDGAGTLGVPLDGL